MDFGELLAGYVVSLFVYVMSKKNAYRMFVGKHQGRGIFRIPRHRSESNIKMYHLRNGL
jgi:hypothetical protein